MCDPSSLAVTFPHHGELLIEHIEQAGGQMLVHARSRQAAVDCPDCARPSSAVHSRYQRRLADLPSSGRPVQILLQVRRFSCHNPACSRRTFVEQVAGLTGRRRRRSIALLGMLQVIALALAGRAGARLAAALAITVSRMTLLRLVRAVPEPARTTPRILGVDDFALRRGHIYATVLLNMDTHRPIEVLPDRTPETFAAWLVAHPGVQIICRDRSGAYAEGARTGAPEAIQVADRFHLWRNLGEAVEKTVVAHRTCLGEAAPTEGFETSPASTPGPERDAPSGEPDGTLDTEGKPRRLVARKQERYAAIQALRAQGYSLNAISRQLGVSFRTVQRYARAGCVEELLAKAIGRPSKVDPVAPYVHQRWREGVTDAVRLHAELAALGWRGSLRSLQRYLRPFRTLTKAPPVVPIPKPRRVTGWIMTDPDHLKPDDAVGLKDILARCPELEATRHHVGGFANMIGHLRGDQLPTWIGQVRADDLPALHSFAAGLEHDWDAVVAGLTLPWSNGPTEGAVNRIKALKRSMYGRAKLDLLRLRILHPI